MSGASGEANKVPEIEITPEVTEAVMDDPFDSVPRGQRRKAQATVQESELRARWFRIKFAFPSPARVEPAPSPTAATESTEREFEPTNAVAIPVTGIVKPYPPVGRCIYCGATEFSPGSGRKLSEEHIVPEGLGAALILPEASCERCAKATGKIEGSVLRTLLWTPRRHLRIRGKKRKRNENAYPVTAIVNGKDVVFYLSLDQHPAMLFLMVFDAPGILVGRPVEQSGVQGVWIQELRRDSLDQMHERGFPQFASPVMDAARFCQMLAKIAHGFAVAELGSDGFEWMLPSGLIFRELGPKENWCGCYRLVGGDPNEYAPSNALHVLGWSLLPCGDKLYLGVAIRLFANLGAPVFQVVVGSLNPAQLEQARILAAARGHQR